MAGIIATTLSGEPMKLVNTKTGHVLIEFQDNAVQFHSPFLEKTLRNEGVLIPPAMRSEFDGKEVVFVEDPLFQKAFREIYWPFYMQQANSSYEWQ